uniref:SWI/SNF nucleosome remodeling complex component (inferred by orthology to a C. elegans protein) n=1 Tax=Strongyloides venezuelensis TaxID=75913 RepID=A0A0K0F227_STRVS
MPFGDSLNRKLLLDPIASYISQLSEEDHEKPEKDFFASYESFAKKKWGLKKQPQPYVNGTILNLYELYTIVKNFGGFMKVTNHELWPEVTKSLNLPGAVNETALIKYIYQRYLLYYEESENGLGETEVDLDENSSSNMGTRSRGRVYYSNSENPVSIEKASNSNSSSMMTKNLGYIIGHGAENGPDYQKLMKHLLSGFENENVFARNLLSMMASPGPYHLKLQQCPILVDILLAKIGIFPVNDPVDYKSGFGEEYLTNWRHKEHCDFDSFWKESGIKEEYAIKLLERQDIMDSIIKYKNGSEVCGMRYDNDDLSFLYHPSIEMNENDPIYFRVLHTTKILRELSFDLDNRAILSKNRNLFTFIMCIAFSRYECLHQNVMDTLNNISEDLDLNDLLVYSNHFGCFMKLVKFCLLSKDRMKICVGLEILGNISAKEGNEFFVIDFLTNEKDVLKQISLLLVPMDVMSLTHTLETVYDLTTMGETVCDLFANENGVLKQLYALLTVEANKFGPCYIQGTKIIQYPPQLGGGQRVVRKFASTPMNRGNTTTNGQTPNQRMSQFSTPRSQIPSRPMTNTLIQTPSMPMRRPSRPDDTRMTSQSETPLPKINEDQDKINLTREWMNSSLRFDPTYESSIKRGKLYCDYVNHFNNKKMLSLNMKNFITLLRETFPRIKFTSEDGQANSCIVGIIQRTPGPNNAELPNDHTALVKTIFNAHAEKEKMAALKTTGNENVSRKRKLTNSYVPNSLESMRESASPEMAESLMDDSIDSRPPSSMDASNSNSEISSPLPKIGSDMKTSMTSDNMDVLCDDSSSFKSTTNGTFGYDGNTENEHPVQEVHHTNGELTTSAPESILQQKLSQKSPSPSEYLDKIDSPICEWQDCGIIFPNASQLYYHIYKTHTVHEEMVCKWNNCERIVRNHWALLSHIHETHYKKPISEEAKHLRMKHGNREYIEQILKNKWKEQENKKSYRIPVKNSFVPPYNECHKSTINGKVVMTPVFNDFTNVAEGPVTKSVRLTAALILRNIATYSKKGRSYLRRYENFISYMAFSKLEANSALSHYLYEIKDSIENSDNDENVLNEDNCVQGEICES